MFGFIDAPNRNASRAETLAFNAFASRESRIENVIEELAQAADPNDEATQTEIFERAGFTSYDGLFPYEVEYIEREVSKRL